MPPKTKRKRTLEASIEIARESKRKRESVERELGTEVRIDLGENEPEDFADLLGMSQEALNTEDEAVDPTFDLDDSVKSDSVHIAESFCEEWVTHLRWDDRASLGLFLHFQHTTVLGKGETEAAELTGMMIGKSDKTIREWRTNFLQSGGEVPESKQGHYQRTGVLWRNENLNKKATRYIRDNASVKGKPNLTAGKFCQWVNNDLLPNETLEPGFPRS